MKEKERLKIYDALRMFHKNKLFPIMDKELTPLQQNALTALSRVLYLVEGVFASEKK